MHGILGSKSILGWSRLTDASMLRCAQIPAAKELEHPITPAVENNWPPGKVWIWSQKFSKYVWIPKAFWDILRSIMIYLRFIYKLMHVDVSMLSRNTLEHGRFGTWIVVDPIWPDHVQGWRILQLDHRAHGRSPTGLVPGHGSFNAENDEQLLVQGTKWIPSLRQPQIQQWSVNCETAVVLPLLSKALGQGASDLGSSPHNLESCAEDVLETLLGFFFPKDACNSKMYVGFGHHQVPFWLWSKLPPVYNSWFHKARTCWSARFRRACGLWPFLWRQSCIGHGLKWAHQMPTPKSFLLIRSFPNEDCMDFLVSSISFRGTHMECHLNVAVCTWWPWPWGSLGDLAKTRTSTQKDLDLWLGSRRGWDMARGVRALVARICQACVKHFETYNSIT